MGSPQIIFEPGPRSPSTTLRSRSRLLPIAWAVAVMYFPFKLDLSNLSGTASAQALFPLLPGFIIAAGIAILHPNVLNAWFAVPHLGYYAELVGLVVAAYAVGLILAALILGVLGGLGGLVGLILGNYLHGKLNAAPWCDATWREITRKFLKEILRVEPPPDLGHPLTREELEPCLKTARMMPDEAERQRREIEIMNENVQKKNAEWAWRGWYWHLDQLFPRSGSSAPNLGMYLSQAAYCSAASLLIILSWTSSPHPVARAICYLLLAILFVERFLASAAPQVSDYSQVRQIASMMQYLIRGTGIQSREP